MAVLTRLSTGGQWAAVFGSQVRHDRRYGKPCATSRLSRITRAFPTNPDQRDTHVVQNDGGRVHPAQGQPVNPPSVALWFRGAPGNTNQPVPGFRQGQADPGGSMNRLIKAAALRCRLYLHPD